MDAGTWALEVEGLSKRYGSTTAVDGLSFRVRPGEIFALLGPNGAGKTTTIKIVSGLLEPNGGRIRVGGLPDGRRRSEAIGLCPQEIVVWETLTCYEQLVFMARMHDIEGRRARSRALELLEAVGLTERRNKLAKTLSGGMRRRLNIILGLVHEPPLVILDEPQAGLDPQGRILVREFVRSLGRDRTVILTTHDMEEADKLADRVAIVDRGRLLALGSPRELKEAEGGEGRIELVLDEEGSSKKERLLAALGTAGLEASLAGGGLLVRIGELSSTIEGIMRTAASVDVGVEDLIVRKRSLEDVFIELTGRGLRE